jgi:hypothetical protein
MTVSKVLARLGLLAVLCLLLGPASLLAVDQSPDVLASSYQLLSNPGMEVYQAPYDDYRGADCQVAQGWERFWYEYPEPYWMDTREFAARLGTGWVEKIEGTTSQMIISTEPYTAGLWQRVSGLTPGVGYGFHAAMLTIFESSAPPDVDGTMVKQVGIDPTGGIDPQAATVRWSEADDHDASPWSIDLRTAVFAQSPAMTVFIRVISPHATDGWPLINQSFLDSAILARTPVVAATSPAVSDALTFTVAWDNAVAAPGGYVRWYDVQWLDESEGVWHDWQTRTSETEAEFRGERGHTYQFRARAWQRYENNAHLYGPYRPQGDTSTWIRGPRLTGRVLSNSGGAIAGATVAVSSTEYVAMTDAHGGYELKLLPTENLLALTVSHPVWLAPAPVQGIALGPTETLTVPWVLRPPDDAIVNGGFEGTLAGWSSLGDVTMAPSLVPEPVHSGQHALALGGSSPAGFSTGLSQTVVLTGSWEPALSFWYQPEVTAADASFQVVLTVVTRTLAYGGPATATIDTLGGPGRSITEPLTSTVEASRTLVFTPPLQAEGWRHQWYSLGPSDRSFTGTATIEFHVGHVPAAAEATTAIYLDEVSLGRTAGGPWRIYLPSVTRSY